MKGAAVKPQVQLGVLEPERVQGFSMRHIRVWEDQASPPPWGKPTRG